MTRGASGISASDGPRHFEYEPSALGQAADHREIELPFVEDRARGLLAPRLQHHEHALLALGEHDLVRRHAHLAHRHAVELELDAEPALGGHLDRGGGEAGGAHVLNGDDRVGRHELKAGLEQKLLGEGIANLHGRPLLLRALVELGGRHGGAVDAVASGLGADIDDRIADAGRGRIEDAVRGC